MSLMISSSKLKLVPALVGAALLGAAGKADATDCNKADNHAEYKAKSADADYSLDLPSTDAKATIDALVVTCNTATGFYQTDTATAPKATCAGSGAKMVLTGCSARTCDKPTNAAEYKTASNVDFAATLASTTTTILSETPKCATSYTAVSGTTPSITVCTANTGTKYTLAGCEKECSIPTADAKYTVTKSDDTAYVASAHGISSNVFGTATAPGSGVKVVCAGTNHPEYDKKPHLAACSTAGGAWAHGGCQAELTCVASTDASITTAATKALYEAADGTAVDFAVAGLKTSAAVFQKGGVKCSANAMARHGVTPQLTMCSSTTDATFKLDGCDEYCTPPTTTNLVSKKGLDLTKGIAKADLDDTDIVCKPGMKEATAGALTKCSTTATAWTITRTCEADATDLKCGVPAADGHRYYVEVAGVKYPLDQPLYSKFHTSTVTVFGATPQCATGYKSAGAVTLSAACTTAGDAITVAGCAIDTSVNFECAKLTTADQLGYTVKMGGTDLDLTAKKYDKMHPYFGTGTKPTIGCAAGYVKKDSAVEPTLSACSAADGKLVFDGCKKEADHNCKAPDDNGLYEHKTHALDKDAKANAAVFTATDIACKAPATAVKGTTVKATACSKADEKFTLAGCEAPPVLNCKAAADAHMYKATKDLNADLKSDFAEKITCQPGFEQTDSKTAPSWTACAKDGEAAKLAGCKMAATTCVPDDSWYKNASALPEGYAGPKVAELPSAVPTDTYFDVTSIKLTCATGFEGNPVIMCGTPASTTTTTTTVAAGNSTSLRMLDATNSTSAAAATYNITGCAKPAPATPAASGASSLVARSALVLLSVAAYFRM